jgi:hypothetical protein
MILLGALASILSLAAIAVLLGWRPRYQIERERADKLQQQLLELAAQNGKLQHDWLQIKLVLDHFAKNPIQTVLHPQQAEEFYKRMEFTLGGVLENMTKSPEAGKKVN